MTKFAICTIGVWGAAFTCAGALAYTLRPPAPRVPMVDADAQHAKAMTLALEPETPMVIANIVELAPTLVLVPARVAVAPPQATEERCAPWRELTQGTAVQVRYCE